MSYPAQDADHDPNHHQNFIISKMDVKKSWKSVDNLLSYPANQRTNGRTSQNYYLNRGDTDNNNKDDANSCRE